MSACSGETLIGVDADVQPQMTSVGLNNNNRTDGGSTETPPGDSGGAAPLSEEPSVVVGEIEG